MRSVYVLLGAILVLPTISAADYDEPRDSLAVTLLRADDNFVHVSWTAAPGALSYALYRGPTPDDLTLITQTPNLEYADAYAPDADTWYVIVSQVPQIDSHIQPGPMRGKCLAMRGLTGFSLTLANCVPTGW